MATGADRLVRQLVASAPQELPEFGSALVTAVTVGGGTDGGDLVTVNYLGLVKAYPHVGTTPSVGQTVAVARWAGNLLILGTPNGFPA